MSVYSRHWWIGNSEWLCLGGIFLLPWRFGIVFGLKLSDVFFFASAVFLAVSLFVGRDAEGEARAAAAKILPFARPALFAMAGILAGAAAGNLYSAVVLPWWSWYSKEVVLEYGRMIVGFGLFGLVVYLGLCRRAFIARASIAALASSLTLWFFIVPAWRGAFILSSDGRLRGPGGDPNYLGSWIAVSLIIAFAAFLWRSDRKGRLSGIAMALLTPLLIWTGSRGALLAASIGLLVVAAHFFLRGRIWGAAAKGAFGGLLLVLGVLLAFVAGSPTLRVAVNDRLVRPFVGQVRLSSPAADRAGADRVHLVIQGLKLLRFAPLGFGPAYYYWQPVGHTPDGGSLEPHNLFLEAGLTAGWLGLASLLYLFWLIGKQLMILFREGGWTAGALLGAAALMLVVSLSLDTLTLRWLWVVAGLSVALAAVYDSGRDRVAADI